MTHYYKLRISLKVVTVDECMLLVNRYCSLKAYATEGISTSNPHQHFYLETHAEQPAFRAAIRRMIGKGNRSYSLGETERFPIQYLAYLLKESDYDLTELPIDIQIEAQEHDAKVKKSMEEKKAARRNIITKMKEELDEIKPTDKYTIAMYVVDYHRNNHLLIRRFQLKCYYDTLCLHYFPDSHRNELVSYIFENG